METALPKPEANARWSLEKVGRIERMAGWRAWAAAETPGKVPHPHHPFPSSVMQEDWFHEGVVLRLTGRTHGDPPAQFAWDYSCFGPKSHTWGTCSVPRKL